MTAVPQQLEDAAGKMQHQDVLHGLFSGKVVDPIDLGSGSAF
jgi:hypothetical protein